MKNKFPREAKLTKVKWDKPKHELAQNKLNFKHYNLLEDDLDKTVETIEKSLSDMNLSLKSDEDRTRIKWEDIESGKKRICKTYNNPDRLYFIPQIIDKFKFLEPPLLLGYMGISIGLKPRTGYEGFFEYDPRYLKLTKEWYKPEDDFYEYRKGIYDILKDRPLRKNVVKALKKEFNKNSISIIKKFVKNEKWEYKSILEELNPHELKWKNSVIDYKGLKIPFVVSISMPVISYSNKKKLTSELLDKIDKKIPEIAEKYNTFFGVSVLTPDNFDATSLMMIPEDLENFSIKPLLNGINDIGTLVLKYYDKNIIKSK